MIALLAAHPTETELLRSRLRADDDTCWRGRIAEREVLLQHLGIGKACAAAATTELLLRHRPSAVILAGCGGAYPETGLHTGDLALAESELFGDEGSQTPAGFLNLEQLRLPQTEIDGQPVYNRIPVDSKLRDKASPLLRGNCHRAGLQFKVGPFVTVSCCSGTDALGQELAARFGGICENMEGAAVALACLKQGVPMMELRGISNLVQDRDPQRWDIPAATTNVQQALIQLLQHWNRVEEP